MGKGLQALKEIKEYSYIDSWDNLHLLKEKYKEELSIIEKELKALEIIKERNVDVYYVMYCESLEDYNNDEHGKFRLTPREYELLIEVLQNG